MDLKPGLDLKPGFWPAELDDDAEETRAFIAYGSLYQFEVLPFRVVQRDPHVPTYVLWSWSW